MRPEKFPEKRFGDLFALGWRTAPVAIIIIDLLRPWAAQEQ